MSARTWFSLLALQVGCAAPEPQDLFNTLEVEVVEGGDAAAEALLPLIDSAQSTLHVALPALEQEELTDAILDAWERGVAVEVLSDQDRAADPGVLALQDAGVPLALADGEVEYHDYAVDGSVRWPSTSVRMTHAFVVADGTRILSATEAGDMGDGSRVLTRLRSEELGEDLLDEFNQVYSGTDASSLTAFNSLAKSITDARWRYSTQTDLDMQVSFGPQERVVKQITDAVYRARSSIWVLTADLSDEGLTRALQNKAETGFDVRVVVGGAFGDLAPGLSDQFVTDAPDVRKFIVPDQEQVPTVVLIDYALDRNGNRGSSQAFVLTHPLVSAGRLYYSSTIPTDQLMDSTLIMLEDFDEPSDPMLELLELVQDHRDRAEDL